MNRLASLGRVLARLRLSDDDDDLAVAEALGDWWAGVPLERALDLPRNWRSAGSTRARDSALLAMDALLVGLPARQRAARIARAIRAGADARWRGGTRPSGMSGLVFDYYAADAAAPIGAEAIRKILRRGVGKSGVSPPGARPGCTERNTPDADTRAPSRPAA